MFQNHSQIVTIKNKFLENDLLHKINPKTSNLNYTKESYTKILLCKLQQENLVTLTKYDSVNQWLTMPPTIGNMTESLRHTFKKYAMTL